MKKTVLKAALAAAGTILLIFAAICPLPAMFAIPGAVWRIMIGLLGCLLFVSGIRKAACKG